MVSCHAYKVLMLKVLIQVYIYSVLQHARGSDLVANQMMTRVTFSMANHARHSARWSSRDNSQVKPAERTRDACMTADTRTKDSSMTRDDPVSLATSSLMMLEADRLATQVQWLARSQDWSWCLKYFPASQTTRTWLLNHCARDS